MIFRVNLDSFSSSTILDVGGWPKGVFMEDFPRLSRLLSQARVRSTISNLHTKISNWADPPSQTEIEKCERAERMVKEAIRSDHKLSGMSIRVFAKGSYANRTNIPADSDVDVGVVAENHFFNDYSLGKGASDFGFEDSTYTFEQFSSDVANAIINKFGRDEVKVEMKCIKVNSNTGRVQVDVVPHFRHRRFQDNGQEVDGVAIRACGETIYNFPDQDYRNAVNKNDLTNKRYKGFVRALKSLKVVMDDEGYQSAKKMKSYLISCLIWNVPNELFEGDNYGTIMGNVLDHLIHHTSDFNRVRDWGEVNELKYLFRDNQPWKLTDVNLFLRQAKEYLEQL